ncbi:MAG: DMT family transporter [Devosia sp.]|jgi:drug/metabolite transporter (DMT)-like permease|nr:DMT family transporter [Devosia sp.]
MSKREALEVSEAGLIEPVPVPAQPDGRPLIGVLMVMASVLLFAGNDIVTKLLVTEYPVPLVAAMRYIVQLVLMMALLLPRMGTRLLKTERTGLVLLRSACLVVSTLGIGLAFQRMPVPESVAIVFLSPMLVVLVAGPVLGEKVAAASVLAAVVGFAGVLLIVRPGGGLDFFGVIFVLIAVTTSVVYYLLSRVLARTESTLTMLFYTALVGAVCFGVTLPWSWSGPTPDFPTLLMFASQGVSAGLGHYLFTAAHREATASLLAPVGYMQLLWVGLLSWVIFGHIPDALTITGMALVTMAGVSIAMISARRR